VILVFVSKTVDESHSARVLIGCKPINEYFNSFNYGGLNLAVIRQFRHIIKHKTCRVNHQLLEFRQCTKKMKIITFDMLMPMVNVIYWSSIIYLSFIVRWFSWKKSFSFKCYFTSKLQTNKTCMTKYGKKIEKIMAL